MLLSGEELICRRGGREVFAGLGFRVAAGEALVVTGRNGAGKSSLLRMIAGLLRIAGGRLALTPENGEQTIGEQTHYLGHQDALKSALSVSENLQFWVSYLGGDGAIAPALERTGLAALAEVPTAYLSAGQKRRLSLARLLAVKRPIWLLDEPSAALDAAGQALLSAIMREHLAEGGLIVAATHGPLGLDNPAELALTPGTGAGMMA